MAVEFEDNRVKVKDAIGSAAIVFLHEACGLLEKQTKQNAKVKTGQTKGSYSYAVDEVELTGYVGSNYENAIWEEFGTGEYALNGDGRIWTRREIGIIRKENGREGLFSRRSLP